MMTNKHEDIPWKRTLDGIYHIKFPAHVTAASAHALWSAIFNDYAEHFAGAGPLLLLVDGSAVERIDEDALDPQRLRVIPDDTSSLFAIHSSSPDYERIRTEYFSAHLMPQNIRFFADQYAAKHWLERSLEPYNYSAHR